MTILLVLTYRTVFIYCLFIMNKRYLLDKIFLSHSSVDKPFVRRLASRLKNDGFNVWLDEKELVPGDKLASKLAQAIESSKIFLIVISENSINSNWLKYELELALRKMVEDDVRLIPILKGDVRLPDQLKGIIYADFRTKYKIGYKNLIRALDSEIPNVAANETFWSQINYLLDVVFDGRGSIGFSTASGFRDIDIIMIRNISDYDDDLDIAYSIISEYEIDPYEEIFKKEYTVDNENIPVQYFLILFEEIKHDSSHNNSKRIHINGLDSPFLDFEQFEVIVDFTGLKSIDSRKSILEETKNTILSHFKRHNTK